MHWVLELVGAGLCVALVPAWTPLQAIDSVVLKGVQHLAPGEVFTLLRRKVRAKPVLRAAVASIFDLRWAGLGWAGLGWADGCEHSLQARDEAVFVDGLAVTDVTCPEQRLRSVSWLASPAS